MLKGKRIVMPSYIRAEILVKLHESNLEIERMRLRARPWELWKGINRDIEGVVHMCAPCPEIQHAQSREPFIPHETPLCAWQIVDTDPFVINPNIILSSCV